MQVPDTNIEVLPLSIFHRETERRGPFYDCVQRYSQGFLILMMQSAACMALHPVLERCCRWLLMTHDRMRRDDFYLSHEFLAMMLGSTRPTVTVVAGTLQKAGLISTSTATLRSSIGPASRPHPASVTRRSRAISIASASEEVPHDRERCPRRIVRCRAVVQP